MERLRRENDLAVLKIRLDRRGVRPHGARWCDGSHAAAEFEFQRGSGPAAPVALIAAQDFGVGERLRGDERWWDRGPPAELLERLRPLVAGDGPLWLQLPPPCGYLRVVAWERMLAPPLDVPVLRLPYYSLRPTSGGEPLEVAVVASSPPLSGAFDASSLVARFVEDIAEWAPRRVRAHVFVDVEEHGAALALARRRDDVVVYDPRGAVPRQLPKRPASAGSLSQIYNAWLAWILRELGGRALDAVHFFGRGHYGEDRGALELAASPVLDAELPERYSRYIGSAELGAFLTASGAWAVGLSGAGADESTVGLWELADSLAQTRPLHVLAHEVDQDPGFGQLTRAWRVMLSNDARPAPLLAAGALWVHPHVVAGTDFAADAGPAEDAFPGGSALDESGRSALLGFATEEALTGEETPAWVAAGTRTLEQVQAQLLGGLGEGQYASLEAVAPEDVQHALALAADLLEAHVRDAFARDARLEPGEGSA